jgi:Pectinacetylesterase
MLAALFALFVWTRLVQGVVLRVPQDGWARIPLRGGGRATCLDGSIPAVFSRISTPSSQSLSAVIVRLQGGSWCFDEADCQARKSGALGTSAPANDLAPMDPNRHMILMGGVMGVGVEGRLGMEGGLLQVLVPSCDGSGFAGVNGEAIVDAVLDEVVRARYGWMGEVVWSGSSSGAIGAAWSSIRHASSTRAVFLDAALFPNTPLYNSTSSSPVLSTILARGAAMWRGPSLRPLPSIFDILASVPAPLFLSQSAYDSATLSLFAKLGCFPGHPPPICDASQLSFAHSVAAETRAMARAVAAERTRRANLSTTIFLTPCVAHTQCCPAQWTAGIVQAHLSLWDAFIRWWHRPLDTVLDIDERAWGPDATHVHPECLAPLCSGWC